MVLSVRYNFLFVHIAKTAGTSVRASLRRLQRRDPLYLLQFLCSRISHATGHRLACKLPRHARIIAAKEMLPVEFFDGLFKFSFVRNPWDHTTAIVATRHAVDLKELGYTFDGS